MRKVKLQMQVSLDGFVAGLNGEQDWMCWDWDDTLNQYVDGLLNSADALLIGRKTYEGMASYWPAAAANPEASAEKVAFASRMNTIEKVIFSNTLTTADWTNARVAQNNLIDEVAALKQQVGEDLIIYGGAGIVSAFIQHNLIDEYHLFVNPVALGTGLPIWPTDKAPIFLRLIKTTVSSSGIVILCYVPA
ncbi:dihydrofolate reductase family protein [Larkinella sp. VNQ87]|uniref:dihydrofolate reductase family protein n=1 Tax=Larkinella sp. VNQ87 TaxID=3400921 RepID=UPI003C0ED6EA